MAILLLIGALFLLHTLKERAAVHTELLSVLCPSLDSLQLRYEILPAVTAAAHLAEVDSALVMAVMAAESRCRPTARSHRGALGLMQLMPATAKWLGVSDPLSIEENISGGAKYLAMLLEQFDGDLVLAVAAYNAGPTRVRRYSGVPPYRETQEYVERVLKFYRQLSGNSPVTPV